MGVVGYTSGGAPIFSGTFGTKKWTTEKCPHCGKRLKSAEGVIAHIQAKHIKKVDIEPLRKAALGLLKEVYVGDGKFVAPNALEPHIRAIAKALQDIKSEEENND